jgi:ferredoxin
MMRRTVSFARDTHAPVSVPSGKTLAEDLHIKNSPVLFGCRTGVCGTCVVSVAKGYDALPPPDDDEKEILELYAEGVPQARLACQIDVQSDITLDAHCEDRWSSVKRAS